MKCKKCGITINKRGARFHRCTNYRSRSQMSDIDNDTDDNNIFDLSNDSSDSDDSDGNDYDD